MDNNPQEPKNQEEKLEIVENKLRELRDQINKMEKENAELFESLGLSPHQLEDFLTDPSLHSPEEYEFIQHARQTLQTILDRRIQDAKAAVRRELPRESIRGHWIFMR